MKLRCAVLDDYQHAAVAMADWSAIAGSVEVQAFHEHFDDEEDLVRAVGHCQIIIAMRERTAFRAPLFARLTNLKLLITTGMRNVAIDLEAAASHGVVVCGTASRSEPPVELTWALILGLARNLVTENQAFRTNGPWQSTVGMDLQGRCLGVLGLGRIGSQVARIGVAFGMDVVAWSQNLTVERAHAEGVRLAGSKEELLETSDFIAIHLLLSERTRGLIGSAELRRMRPTAYLINTSRSAIVDEGALVEALRGGWIAGAGVDVFDVEPLPGDHVLRSLPNLLATPHLGFVSVSNYRIYYREAVEDIAAFLAGTPLRVLN